MFRQTLNKPELAPLPEDRHHLMAAAYDGRIYVFGGASGRAWQPTNTTWAYVPGHDTWSELASMPETRVAGAAVSLGDYLYVIGGTGGTAALLRYDATADTWTSLASLNQPREHTAAGCCSRLCDYCRYPEIHVMSSRN